jgi:hypothetical protein
MYLEPLDFINNSATICDAQGNLLFSSNGCIVCGKDDQILLNGDTLNPGYYFDEFCTGPITGYPTVQDIFFLPHPLDTNLYYLIHAGVGNVEQIGGINENVYYTLLDKRLDDGRGDVLEKNVVILNDTMSLSSLSAIRHGNGIDWWIITSEYATDNYIFLRLDEAGVYESHRQNIGNFNLEDGQTGQNNFSPDGNWFARFGRFNGLALYQFNRCEGSLHDPLYDIVPSAQDTTIGTGAVAFSADSRMLYLITNIWIYQYDLWADDIIGSKMLVAVWDGTNAPLPSAFYLPQIGPDDKIYISAVNTIPYLHVIEHPNERGWACEVNQLGFPLPANNGLLIPYFPNYRLEGLGPGGCDSLPTSIAEHPVPVMNYELSLMPNPATNHINISFKPKAKDEDELILRDISGRVVVREQASFGIIDIGHLPSGLYWLEWYSDKQLLSVEKLLHSRRLSFFNSA